MKAYKTTVSGKMSSLGSSLVKKLYLDYMNICEFKK